MTAALRVGLLFGGASVEHEVSLTSARGVLVGLRTAGHEVVPIAARGDGRWLPPDPSRAILEGRATRVDSVDVPDAEGRIVVDPGRGGLLHVGPRGGIAVRLDALFAVMHGWGGEDGRLQGALELGGIAVVGSGVLGSAAGMDKEHAKRIFESHGLPVVPWRVVRRAEGSDLDETAARLSSAFDFPVFVKPANGGSSVGVVKVKEPASLPAALDEAFRFDHKVIVEKGIDAREIECAVIGNDRPEASIVGEIVPSREFYDYAAKYLDGTSELRIPAPIDEATSGRVRAVAVRAFAALDLAGMARVDFLLDRDSGRLFLNEVNTLPGFTPISMYPKLWEASGLLFPDLVDRLVRLALQRKAADDGLTKRWGG